MSPLPLWGWDKIVLNFSLFPSKIAIKGKILGGKITFYSPSDPTFFPTFLLTDVWFWACTPLPVGTIPNIYNFFRSPLRSKCLKYIWSGSGLCLCPVWVLVSFSNWVMVLALALVLVGLGPGFGLSLSIFFVLVLVLFLVVVLVLVQF